VDLLVAGIIVGSAYYDGVSSRAITDRYKIETRLPGFRPRRERYASQDEAEAALERLTIAWFAKMAPLPGPLLDGQ
jgi:hypothetical protein